MVEKLLLPFSLLSDPDGDVIRRYGVWDEEGQIARPAIFVIDDAHVLRYAYVGDDFADRPADEPMLEVLAAAAGGSE